MLLDRRPGPYLHLIAETGSHHRRRRYSDAAHQVRRRFRPAASLAVELGSLGTQYAFGRNSERHGCPSDIPDVAVFLTDPAGDLNQWTYEHLMLLVQAGVPLWRVISHGDNGPAGVHRPSSYVLRLRGRSALRYARAEQRDA